MWRVAHPDLLRDYLRGAIDDGRAPPRDIYGWLYWAPVDDRFPEHSGPSGAYAYFDFDGVTVWLALELSRGARIARRDITMFADFAFHRIGARRIAALIAPDNAQCLKMADQMGFRLEGRLRSSSPRGDDELLYALLQDDMRLGRPKSKEITP